MIRKIKTSEKGLSIVELIVALGIISILMTALIGAFLLSLRAVVAAEKESRAYFYAQDAIEAIKNIRDRKWDEIINVTVDDVVHVEEQDGEWKLLAGSDSSDIFTREVRLQEVLRDINGDIVESGGTADENMRRIDVTVSYPDRDVGTKTIALSNYVTNWQYMNSFISYFHQTNASDFEEGILNNVDAEARPGDLLLQRTPIYIEDFNDFSAGVDPTNWVDTEDEFGLTEEDNFEIYEIDSSNHGTTSDLKNIHTHYNGAGASAWTNYEVKGRMMYTDDRGGMGITFFSKYPTSNKYYRLMTNDASSLHVDAVGTSITALGVDDRDTEVVMSEGVWYWFRIQARDVSNQTLIVAKVWEDGTREPRSWQVDCYSDAGDRSSAGTVGLWTIDQGSKYIDDIEIRNLDTYESSGTLESVTFDTGTVTNFDRIKWNADIVPNTTLKLQVRTADTNDNLPSATWYGPDGAGTYFDTNSFGEKLHANHDGDRWIQYKAILDTSNTAFTPALEDVTISYAEQ
ncbi:MAG: type II secretion system protein [bacterium]